MSGVVKEFYVYVSERGETAEVLNEGAGKEREHFPYIFAGIIFRIYSPVIANRVGYHGSLREHGLKIEQRHECKPT